MELNVLIVNQYAIPPTQAGITRHHMLARELVALGHEVTIIASSFDHVTQRETRLERGAPFTREDCDGVTFLWLKTPPYTGNSSARIRNMVSFAWNVWRRVGQGRAYQPDVVLGSSPHLFAGLAAARLASRLRAPFVLEVRDLWPQSLIDLGNVPRTDPVVVLLEHIERYLYRRSDSIVTVLPSAQDHIVSKGGRADSIIWIPNGVDLSRNGHIEEEAPTEEASPSRPFTVMYAGTHGFANALDSVLDAAALVQNAVGNRVAFDFVGDGPLKEQLRRRAAAEGLDVVSFSVPVPKQEMSAKLRSADAFIVTLRDVPLYRHGTSLNKIYDYMAAGRPIVFGVADESNPVSAVDAGLAVQPEDSQAMAHAVLKLMGMSANQRQRMGERGRAFVEEHHDVAKLALRLEKVLSAAVERGSRKAPDRTSRVPEGQLS